MSKIVPHQDTLFQKCGEILDTQLRPIHYKELTAQALQLMGLSESEVDFKRTIEDVREKMLARKANGLYSKYFYVGKPHCMGAVWHWFQPQLLQCEPFLIPPIELEVSFLIDSIYEALMRPMIQKNPNASKSDRESARAHGLGIEWTVSRWFELTYPSLYLPPDNFRKWNQSCDHDFKLRIPPDNKIMKVDVYSKWKEKHPTDLHLLCQLTDDRKAVELVSVFKKDGYLKNLDPIGGKAPAKLIVWLNCLANGVDYSAFWQVANGQSLKQVA